MEHPNCTRCRAYYVTWEAEHPHGCRAFGFKSKALPSRVVEESSSRPCVLFEERVRPTRDSRGGSA